MDKGDVRIVNAIVHIMDSTLGMPVLSDAPLEYGSDMADFMKEHIAKTISSDDMKKCKFIEEESEVYRIIDQYRSDDDFLKMSKAVGEFLYGIMNSNIDIPPADLFVIRFEINRIAHLALLKMNYRESYTHVTSSDGEFNTNSIMKHRSILPGETQKLSEAAIIRLDDMTVKIIEKKYDVNGQKVNYFSKIFLKCTTRLSQKAKLAIVEKAVEAVQKEFCSESQEFEEKMKARSVIHNEMVEQGSISIPDVVEKVFEDKPEKEEMKEKFKEKIEKYHIDEKEPIEPKNEATTKKFGKQNLITDTGIEIKIPMDQYNSTENIEFLTNDDGTISMLIKNIGHIRSK